MIARDHDTVNTVEPLIDTFTRSLKYVEVVSQHNLELIDFLTLPI